MCVCVCVCVCVVCVCVCVCVCACKRACVHQCESVSVCGVVLPSYLYSTNKVSIQCQCHYLSLPFYNIGPPPLHSPASFYTSSVTRVHCIVSHHSLTLLPPLLWLEHRDVEGCFVVCMYTYTAVHPHSSPSACGSTIKPCFKFQI